MPDQDPEERVLEDQKLVAERKNHVGKPLHPPKEENMRREDEKERSVPPLDEIEGSEDPI